MFIALEQIIRYNSNERTLRHVAHGASRERKILEGYQKHGDTLPQYPSAPFKTHCPQLSQAHSQ